ncbi:MAG: MazG nucleotide pyrophosphohydrolase domain-containing protein [Candidatus Izemoplasmataceae bacterium]|jgi:NTP pyrophosphatase (non-canonical NTP hydrolase)|uniref:MazG nucleotide pyrophosphohydrolase domain-containing protein n=1 Tax=Liberiplasma polymorphum TaxID=3374570 RepID=UPI0037733BF4
MQKHLTIKDLQNHIKMVDFNPEKKYEVVLKLFEEVGELSVEMRKAHQLGLTDEVKKNIKYELYDVLHYVTVLANIYDIDLEEAIIEKDQINAKRYNDREVLK